MIQNNKARTDSEKALDAARRAGGERRNAGAREYAADLTESIHTSVTDGAERTQRRWDHDGTPRWMLAKQLFQRGGHRG